jgi:hypothetical protein
LAQAPLPVSQKPAGPLQSAQEPAILNVQQQPLELGVMPDRLLLAGFDVRQGLFQEPRERQEFPP